MAGYIGTQPVPQATQTRDAFTCTAGQTSFATSGYTPGFLDVHLNGIKLAAADYTASNGSDVVLASGAALDDILEVVAYTSFEVVTDTVTNAGTVLNLDRTGSDGTILDLKKDGSSVGSIGTINGDTYIGTGDTTLLFKDGNNAIYPRDATGAARDGAIDWGGASNRFKDLYLSGGVVFGDAGGSGTVAGNTLDSYEEGNWTPVVADASSGGNTASGDFVGRYTLIGNQCTVWCRLVNINTSGMTGPNNIYIRGVPFSSSSATTQAHAAVMCDRIIFDGYVVAQLPSSSAIIEFRTITSSAQDQPVVISDVTSNGSDILFTLTYRIP